MTKEIKFGKDNWISPSDSQASLIIRTCDKNRKAYNNFEWPELGYVEALDWQATANCGHGLHGQLWGKGSWNNTSKDYDALWLVVRVWSDEVIEIDNEKCKFPRGEVVYCGNKAKAMTMVLTAKWRIQDMIKTTGDYAHSATTGNYAHSATTGNYAYSATTGDYAHSATTGDSAYSATTGDYAHSATTGNYAHSATTGYSAHSRAKGEKSIAVAIGQNSIVSAGKDGCIVAAYWSDKHKRFIVKVGYVGQKGIVANKDYTLQDGKFIEVK